MTEKMFPPARILGIESSCDETAAAIVENGRKVLSNVVASQAEIHAKYGGVFPEVASRQHIRTVYSVVDEALAQAHLSLGDIDAIAVTQGPGLPGSLVVGLNMAKGLALGSGKPLVGVHHLEGHLYSGWIDESGEEDEPTPEPEFPLLALLVFLIQGTTGAAEGTSETISNALRAVVSMGGIMTIVSAVLFPVVWSE